MLETRKAITLTGISTIEDSSGTTISVANMYASISEDGNPNITKTILDRSAYLENTETVLNDMCEFETAAWALVQ